MQLQALLRERQSVSFRSLSEKLRSRDAQIVELEADTVYCGSAYSGVMREGKGGPARVIASRPNHRMQVTVHTYSRRTLQSTARDSTDPEILRSPAVEGGFDPEPGGNVRHLLILIAVGDRTSVSKAPPRMRQDASSTHSGRNPIPILLWYVA